MIGPVGIKVEKRHWWFVVEVTKEKENVATTSKQREPQYKSRKENMT